MDFRWTAQAMETGLGFTWNCVVSVSQEGFVLVRARFWQKDSGDRVNYLI